MDRLGDDLTEEILQYLTFEDKIRLECVSKQWQRCVFTKQFGLDIVEGSKQTMDSLRIYRKEERRSPIVDMMSLESVLKKCPNIKKVNIEIEVESEVLSLIGQNCPNIKSLRLSPTNGSAEKSMSFFRMYGHKLEELDLNPGELEEEEELDLKHGCPKFIDALQFCQNLKIINYESLSYYLTRQNEFLPKLERIKSTFTVCDLNCNKLTILSNKYSQTMKTLDVKLDFLSTDQLKTSINNICRFENLTELKLEFMFVITEPIDNSLSLIGQKCNTLLKLDLSIGSEIPISDRFFYIFNKFEAIKKLKIKLEHNTVLAGSVECLKNCKQLNELEIIYSELREDFFANIETFVPKLKLLQMETRKHFSDSFINYLHSIKNIRSVDHSFISKNNMNWNYINVYSIIFNPK